MKSKEDREREFREDFKALLEKHGAEFELDTYGYSDCVSSKAVITMHSDYDENNEIARDFCEFDL